MFFAAIDVLASLVLNIKIITAFNIFILVISLFAFINAYRLFKGRKIEKYLLSISKRSARDFLILTTLLILVSYVYGSLNLKFNVGVIVFSIINLVFCLAIYINTLKAIKTTSPIKSVTHLSDHELPTLTVAIPARNETLDLEECLSSLIKSDYPKLEIIALDDCSVNKRTPEIIRNFAHDGVTFLAGKEMPSNSWFAKNYAYKQLADASNGSLILFCGVDTRFEESTLRSMVELMLDRKKSMLSFMPINKLSKKVYKSLSIQPARYLWELSLPRNWLKRPPVLSTCWLIRKDNLIANGGFGAVSRSIIPERYFARQSKLFNNGYGFVQSDYRLGLVTNKDWIDQRKTALRTRYPILGQRLELVSVVIILQFIIFLGPVISLIYSIVTTNLIVFILGALTYLFASYSFYEAAKITFRKSILGAIFYMPVIVLYDIYLLIESMWKYEFGVILWKDRNVCVPVMRVIPNLPNLE